MQTRLWNRWMTAEATPPPTLILNLLKRSVTQNLAGTSCERSKFYKKWDFEGLLFNTQSTTLDYLINVHARDVYICDFPSCTPLLGRKIPCMCAKIEKKNAFALDKIAILSWFLTFQVTLLGLMHIFTKYLAYFEQKIKWVVQKGTNWKIVSNSDFHHARLLSSCTVGCHPTESHMHA